MRRFLHSFAIGLDYAMALIFFWRRLAPMTVSSHAGLALRRGERATVLARFGLLLNRLDPGHTEGAIAADIARAKTTLAELES